MKNAAVTTLVALCAAAPASAQMIEPLGSDFNIGYASLDSKAAGVDADGFYLNGRSSALLFGSDFGVTINTGYTELSDGALTQTARSFGLVGFYQPSPNLRLGVFGDAATFKDGSVTARLNNFGVEGSYAIGDAVTLGAYVGSYDSETFVDFGTNYGLRADYQYDERLSVYGAYDYDELSPTTDNLGGVTLGASYQVTTVLNRPVNFDLGLSRLEQAGDRIDSVRFGVSVPLFTTFRDTGGWQGGPHGAYLGLVTGE